MFARVHPVYSTYSTRHASGPCGRSTLRIVGWDGLACDVGPRASKNSKESLSHFWHALSPTPVKFLVIAIAVAFSSNQVLARPSVIPVELSELVARSDVIAVVTVTNVEPAGDDIKVDDQFPPVKVATAEVVATWKGPIMKAVRFVASPTRPCDMASAAKGEKLILFLEQRGSSPIMSIAHVGRGRMPLREINGGQSATIDLNEVVLPTGVKTVETRESLAVRFPATVQEPGEVGRQSPDDFLVVHAVELNVLRDLVRRDVERPKRLKLSRSSLSDAGLADLRGITSLSELLLNRTRVSDAGLGHLKGLTNLSLLQLAHTQVTDAGLTDLKGLIKLAELDLSDTQVTDAGLANLATLKNLSVLNLGGTKLTDSGLMKLEGLTKLAELDLAGTRITDRGLPHLSTLTNLYMLDLSYTAVTDAGLTHLKGLKKLSTLKVFGTAVSDGAIKALGLPSAIGDLPRG